MTLCYSPSFEPTMAYKFRTSDEKSTANFLQRTYHIAQLNMNLQRSKSKTKKAKSPQETAARLKHIAWTSENRLGLEHLDWKNDIELLASQQLPHRNPGFIPPPPIPKGFEPSEPHFIWVVKQLGQAHEVVCF